MRAVVLTGTGPRHRYFTWQAARRFEIAAAMCEEKKNHYETQRQESAAVRGHFARLGETERAWFPADSEPPALRPVADINAAACVETARAARADIVLLFGTAILRQPWLEAFPERIVNLHLGLSPFYRGSATLFWPFYYREPECVGATIHLAVERVDAGAMLRRVLPDWRADDDYYALTWRLVRKSIDETADTAAAYLEGRVAPLPQEPGASRLCRKAEFTEAALRTVLDYVGGGLGAAEIARIKASDKCRCSP